jgi:hypothetical protein
MHMYMFVSNYIYSLRPCLFIHTDIVDHLIFRAVSQLFVGIYWSDSGNEIVNNESKHAVEDINTGGKKTIYLHL